MPTDTWTFSAVPGDVRRARHAIAAFVADIGASRELREAIELCVSEAASNSVQHAYDDATEHAFRLTASIAARQLTISIDDDGGGFNLPSHTLHGHGLDIMARLSPVLGVHTTSTGTRIALQFELDR